MSVKQFLPTDGMTPPLSKTAFLLDGYWSGFEIRRPTRVRIGSVDVVYAMHDMSVMFNDRFTFDLRIED